MKKLFVLAALSLLPMSVCAQSATQQAPNAGDQATPAPYSTPAPQDRKGPYIADEHPSRYFEHQGEYDPHHGPHGYGYDGHEGHYYGPRYGCGEYVPYSMDQNHDHHGRHYEPSCYGHSYPQVQE